MSKTELYLADRDAFKAGQTHRTGANVTARRPSSPATPVETVRVTRPLAWGPRVLAPGSLAAATCCDSAVRFHDTTKLRTGEHARVGEAQPFRFSNIERAETKADA